MAVIIDDFTEHDCIGNIRGSVDDLNKARIAWDWPHNTKYNYCIVFEVQEDDSLENLLKNCPGRTTYQDQFNLTHSADVKHKYIQFKIYPARKGADGGLEIVNQTKNNLSPRFLRKTKLSYTVEYRKKGFPSSGMTAIVRMKPVSEICEGYLCYRIIGGRRQDVKYPIDLNRFCKDGSFQVLMEKGEELALVLDERQREYIELIRD